MATRMQQRRGTATQWTSANPILASGEIGLETDTNKFKIGNGLATWSSLQYFNDVQDLLELYVPLTQRGANNGVATLDSSGKLTSSQLPTIDELTQDAINTALVAGTGLDKTYNDAANTITIDIDSTVATKTYADTVADDAQTAAELTASQALSSHASDTTNIHGIADVAALALTSDVQDLVDYHAGLTTNVHGIADTAQLATKTYADDAVSTHNSDTTNVHGIADTSKLVTSDAASQTISGDVTITGDLVVQGTQTSVNTSSFSLADNMIYLNEAIEYEITNATGNGTNQTYTTSVDHGITDSMVIRTSWIDPTGYNISSFVPVVSVTANTVTVAGTYSGSYVSGGLLRAKAAVNPDFGISAGYNDGSYHHGGLFRDATDGNWKFFQGYVPEPSGIEIDTADATFDLAPIAVSAITTTDITATGDVDFSAATVTGIDALPSQSTHNGQFLTTDGSTASWATVDALPSQSGNTGKFLTTDGTDASWVENSVSGDISVSSVTLVGEKEVIANVVSSTQNPVDAATFPIIQGTLQTADEYYSSYNLITVYSDTSGVWTTEQQDIIDYLIANPNTDIGVFASGYPENLVTVNAASNPYLHYDGSGRYAVQMATSYGQTFVDFWATTPSATITIGMPTTTLVTDSNSLQSDITNTHFGIGTTFFKKSLQEFPGEASNTVNLRGLHTFTSANDVEQYTPTSSNLTYVKADGTSATITPLEWTYLDGVTGPVQRQINTKASTSGATFNGLTRFNFPISKRHVVFGSLGQIPSLSVYYNSYAIVCNSESLADQVINIRGGDYAELSSVTQYGDELEFIVYALNGATPYMITGVTIDGTSQPVVWENGAPESGTANAYDKYVFKVINAGGNFVVFGSMSPFGAAGAGGSSGPVDINAQTGTSYTLVTEDANNVVEVSNSSAITVTVPPNSSVAYPVGTQITILQTGTGQITVSGAVGVTLNSTPGSSFRAQWSSATLLKRATDTWVLIGDLVTTVVSGGGGGGGGGGGSDSRLKNDILPLEFTWTTN